MDEDVSSMVTGDTVPPETIIQGKREIGDAP
jgi:hypothetical protein